MDQEGGDYDLENGVSCLSILAFLSTMSVSDSTGQALETVLGCGKAIRYLLEFVGVGSERVKTIGSGERSRCFDETLLSLACLWSAIAGRGIMSEEPLLPSFSTNTGIFLTKMMERLFSQITKRFLLGGAPRWVKELQRALKTNK